MAPALDILLPDVLSAGRGDRDAFARLVSATSRLVASITLAETRDLETSRDAAQEAFLHAWRDLPRLKNPASFLPWLRELARRRARELGSRGRATGGASAEVALATAVDPAPLAESRLVDAEGRRVLSEALAALPDEAREVVLLYYREGQSAAQVAGLLELSEAAVWQRLSRARARLRQDLLERAGEVAAATAPGPAFTALVVAALGTAAPGAAAAATVASTGVGLGSGVAFGAVGAAWLAGSLGLAFQTRVLLARAVDDAERAALRRFARANQVTIASRRPGHAGRLELGAPLALRRRLRGPAARRPRREEGAPAGSHAGLDAGREGGPDRPCLRERARRRRGGRAARPGLVDAPASLARGASPNSSCSGASGGYSTPPAVSLSRRSLRQASGLEEGHAEHSERSLADSCWA